MVATIAAPIASETLVLLTICARFTPAGLPGESGVAKAEVKIMVEAKHAQTSVTRTFIPNSQRIEAKIGTEISLGRRKHEPMTVL